MRIVVIGISGSGKTTLAKQIATQHGLRHVELDALYWLSNWQIRDVQEFRALVADAVSQEQWIADGNYRIVRDLIWNRATTVIWLNYPLWRVMGCLLRRTLQRILTQEALFSENRETFRKSFLSRDSLLWYVLTHYHATRSNYRQIFDSRPFPHVEFVEITTPWAAAQYMMSRDSGHVQAKECS